MKLMLATDAPDFSGYFWLLDGIKRVGLDEILADDVLYIRNKELLRRPPTNVHELDFDEPEANLYWKHCDGILYIPSDADMTASPYIKEWIETLMSDDRWTTARLNNDYGWLYRKNGMGGSEDKVWLNPKLSGHYQLLYPDVYCDTAPIEYFKKKCMPEQVKTEARGILWIIGQPTSGTTFLAGYLAQQGWHTNWVQQFYTKDTEWTPDRTFYDDYYTQQHISAAMSCRYNQDPNVMQAIELQFKNYIADLRHHIPDNFFLKATDMASKLFRLIGFHPYGSDKIIVMDKQSDTALLDILMHGTVLTKTKWQVNYRLQHHNDYYAQQKWVSEHAIGAMQLKPSECLRTPCFAVERLNTYLGTNFDKYSMSEFLENASHLLTGSVL